VLDGLASALRHIGGHDRIEDDSQLPGLELRQAGEIIEHAVGHPDHVVGPWVEPRRQARHDPVAPALSMCGGNGQRVLFHDHDPPRIPAELARPQSDDVRVVEHRDQPAWLLPSEVADQRRQAAQDPARPQVDDSNGVGHLRHARAFGHGEDEIGVESPFGETLRELQRAALGPASCHGRGEDGEPSRV
jgi:hypothetical protein